MTESTPTRRRATYLSVVEMFNLDHQCLMLRAAGLRVYLVGSCISRPDYRDVDLRAIMEDGDFDAMFGKNKARLGLMNTAVSEWLAARTGLPIDFQFQRQTEANAEYDGERNAMGLRHQEWA